LNLKLGSKQYNKIIILGLTVVPQISGVWQHNYSTKTKQAGCGTEQSVYSDIAMTGFHDLLTKMINTKITGTPLWMKCPRAPLKII